MSCVVIIIPVIVPTQGANENIMIETAYCIVVAYFGEKREKRNRIIMQVKFL